MVGISDIVFPIKECSFTKHECIDDNVAEYAYISGNRKKKVREEGEQALYRWCFKVCITRLVTIGYKMGLKAILNLFPWILLMKPKRYESMQMCRCWRIKKIKIDSERENRKKKNKKINDVVW